MSSTFIINPTNPNVSDKCIIEERFKGIKYFNNREVISYKQLNENSYTNTFSNGVLGTREHPIEFVHSNYELKNSENTPVQVHSVMFNNMFDMSEVLKTKAGIEHINHEILDPNFNEFVPTLNMNSHSLKIIEDHLNNKEDIYYDITATKDVKNKYSQKKHLQYCEFETLPTYRFNEQNEIIRFKYSKTFEATPTNHLLSPYHDIDVENCSNYNKLITFLADDIFYFFEKCGWKKSKKVVTIIYYCVKDIHEDIEDELKILKNDIREESGHELDYEIIYNTFDKDVCKKDFSARIIFNAIKIDSVMFDAFMKYTTKYILEQCKGSVFANEKVLDTACYNKHNQVRNFLFDKPSFKDKNSIQFKRCGVYDPIIIDANKYLKTFVTFFNPSYEYMYIVYDRDNVEFNARIGLNFEKERCRKTVKQINKFSSNNFRQFTNDDSIEADFETKKLINSLESQSTKKYIIAALINYHKQQELRYGNRYGVLATLLRCYNKDETKFIMDEVYKKCNYVSDHVDSQIDSFEVQEIQISWITCLYLITRQIENKNLISGIKIKRSEKEISKNIFETEPVYISDRFSSAMDWNEVRKYIMRKYAKLETGKGIIVTNKLDEYNNRQIILIAKKDIAENNNRIFVTKDVKEKFSKRKTLFTESTINDNIETYSIKDSSLLFELGLSEELRQYRGIEIMSSNPYMLSKLTFPSKLEDNDVHVKLYSECIEKFIDDRIVDETKHNFYDLLDTFSYIIRYKTHSTRNYLMQSKVGAGKNLFVEQFLTPLITDTYVDLTLDVDKVLATQFNTLADYVIRMINEVDSIKSTRKAVSFLKTISDLKIEYRNLYVPRSNRDNIALNIFTSNDPYFGGLFTGDDDTYINRSALILFNSINDKDGESYMNKLCMNDLNSIPRNKLRAVIYTYFMNRDISKYNTGRYNDAFTYNFIKQAKLSGRADDDKLMNAFDSVDFNGLITVSLANASSELNGFESFNKFVGKDLSNFAIKVNGTELAINMINNIREKDQKYNGGIAVREYIKTSFGDQCMTTLKKDGKTIKSRCVYYIDLNKFDILAETIDGEIKLGNKLECIDFKLIVREKINEIEQEPELF